MKRTIKIIQIILIGIIIFGTTATAAEFSVGTDVVSRHVWRGNDFGNSPSIQPTLEYSIAGLAIGTWGAVSTQNDVYQELDLYINYTIKDMVSIGITDYFFPEYKTPTSEMKYFNYNNEETGHIFEANLAFLGAKSFPISISTNIAFYGDDKKEDEDEKEVEKVNNYSTYIEAEYSGKLNNVDYSIFVGFTPTEDLYGGNPGVVNTGLTIGKEVKISEEYAITMFSSLIFNPQREMSFFVFGVTL